VVVHTGQQQIGQAPSDLAILQSFVNTLDIEQSTDELDTPAAVTSWLSQAGLLPGADMASPAEQVDAVELREALRGVLRSHVSHKEPGARARGDRGPGDRGPDDRAQGPSDPDLADAAGRLRGVSARFPARLGVSADGRIQPAPAGSGVQAALARILLIASESATLGTWTRLKVCSADDCQWAFYDRSPTRNGCWCSMQICGARAKSRAYRARVANERARRQGSPGRQAS
jgi:predicted RNA-binding Zn ribbon-like protein